MRCPSNVAWPQLPRGTLPKRSWLVFAIAWDRRIAGQTANITGRLGNFFPAITRLTCRRQRFGAGVWHHRRNGTVPGFSVTGRTKRSPAGLRCSVDVRLGKSHLRRLERMNHPGSAQSSLPFDRAVQTRPFDRISGGGGPTAARPPSFDQLSTAGASSDSPRAACESHACVPTPTYFDRQSPSGPAEVPSFAACD